MSHVVVLPLTMLNLVIGKEALRHVDHTYYQPFLLHYVPGLRSLKICSPKSVRNPRPFASLASLASSTIS